MSYWDHLELKISIKDAEIDIGENIDQSNLEVIVKLTSGAVETVSVANSTNEIYFDITNQYDVLRFSLVERDTQLLFGTVSFNVSTFNEKLNFPFRQWVSLKSTPSSDLFNGILGEHQITVPRILVSFEAIPSQEERKTDDKNEGLIKGNVYTKGNLKVVLQNMKIDPSKWRGRKAKEETIATLSEVEHTDIEKHMERKTLELIDIVRMEKQKLSEEEDK